MENGFREYLSSANIAPFIAMKFKGGTSWYNDPIIKAEALGYLRSMHRTFVIMERELRECAEGIVV
jgi:hypothetical protein